MRGARLVALAGAMACGLPVPEPFPRVVGASPRGGGVSTLASAEVRFSDPVDPAGLTDGSRLVLVPGSLVSEAKEAVESEAGAVGLRGAVGCEVVLADGGRSVALSPLAPLRAYTPHALVLSSRIRAADGRQVLDPEGRRRTFVSQFETGAPVGPPPLPTITEVRADAATPEAGGEYVEVGNLGAGDLDLSGWRLSKRTSAGSLCSCTMSATLAVVAPGGIALVAGGAYDGRYALAANVLVLACGATSLLGGIANDRAPEILLVNPLGETTATFGAAGGPVCPTAAERVDLAAPDEPANIACTEGTPGSLPAR